MRSENIFKTITILFITGILGTAMLSAGCSGSNGKNGATGATGPAGLPATSGTVIPPSVPGTLTLTSGPALMITLSWQDNSTNEEGFGIERGTNGVNFITIGTTPSNTAGYQDNGLAKGTAYYYRVRAFNDAGFSAYSNIAQSLIAWVNTYGGASTDIAQFIQQTADGGYIVAGYTISFGAGGYNAWVLKLNSDGTVAWQKIYGGAGTDYAYSIQQTTDGGYIVAGYTNSYGAGGYDAWVLKLNSDGTIAWQKTYGGASTDIAQFIQQTADGGYIVAGYTNSYGAGGYNAWVLKLNSDGTVAWQKTYGGASTDYTQSIQQTADGGYIVAGSTYSYGAGGNDAWVLKLNSDGTIAWQKTYGGASTDYTQSIQQTADGGYIVAGYTDSYGAGGNDAWVLKLNSDGTIAWQKTYGGAGTDYAYSIQQTADGGYIVAGYTDSFGAGDYDAWVLKLNSDGTIAWQKTYGGAGTDYAYSIQQTTDGGYIVAGYTDSFGAGDTDAWVLRLPADGSVSFKPSSGASSASTSVNPANSSATINNTAITGADTVLAPGTSTATPSSTNAYITEQAP